MIKELIKKHFKAILITTVSVFILLVAAALISIRLGEVSNNKYNSYEEAYMEGIMKGWIPSFIPLSSKNIRTHEDLDTASISWSALEYTPGDDSLIYEKCALIEKKNELDHMLCEENVCAVLDAKNGKATFYLASNRESCSKEKLK